MLGRETKILLGLLGGLSTGFVGVLGSKLLSPRPPSGTGPDVHVSADDLGSTEIVEPPSFEPLARSAFTSPDEHAGDPAAAGSVTDESLDESLAPPAASFRSPVPDEPAVGSADTGPAITEPHRVDDVDDETAFSRNESETTSDAATAEGLAHGDTTAMGYEPNSSQSSAGVVRPIAGSHVVTEADTWWNLAERAYGDGRLYKPLYAWNRSIDPRIALVPGTTLEVPPLENLVAARDAAVPGVGRSPVDLDRGVQLASASEPVPMAGRTTVVVRPGDTLLSIAREHLGSSTRWRDVYEANRESLGRSPGPLVPGMQLILP